MDSIVTKFERLSLELRALAARSCNSDIMTIVETMTREAREGPSPSLNQLLAQIISIPDLQDDLVAAAREIADGLHGGKWAFAIDENVDLDEYDVEDQVFAAEMAQEMRVFDQCADEFDDEDSYDWDGNPEPSDTDSLEFQDHLETSDVDTSDEEVFQGLVADVGQDLMQWERNAIRNDIPLEKADAHETSVRMFEDAVNIAMDLIEIIRDFEDLDDLDRALDDILGESSTMTCRSEEERIKALEALVEQGEIDPAEAWEEVDSIIDQFEAHLDAEPETLIALRQSDMLLQAQYDIAEIEVLDAPLPDDALSGYGYVWQDYRENHETRSDALACIASDQAMYDEHSLKLRAVRPDVFPGGNQYDAVLKYLQELQAIDEIKVEQLRTDTVFDPNAFELLVREVGQDFGKDLKWEPEAFRALQVAAEAHLVDLYGDINRAGIHADRTHIISRDVILARHVRRERY